MIQINFRIEDDLKSEADYVLSNIGINMSSALNMFIRQLVAHRGIPFEVRMPSLRLRAFSTRVAGAASTMMAPWQSTRPQAAS